METMTAPNSRPPATPEEIWAILREVSETQKKTDLQMLETDRRMQETDRRMQETDRRMQETDQIVKNIGKRMGYMDNRFGELAEHLVAPGIMEKFNEMGFKFTRCSNSVKIKEKDNPNTIAEIDILLENGDIVIAVEVKAKPNDKDVKDHIERMEKLRFDANQRDDKRKYCGAIAAAIMSENIRRLILEKGFYAIEQTGDTMKINVPPGFVPKEF